MRRTVEQFMWGYQSHFRHSFQALARHSLLRIGLHVAPEALLVGFLEEGDSPWPICIEPETAGYDPSLLDGVVLEADSRLEHHPEADMIHSDPSTHSNMMAERTEDCRRDAISDALADSEPGAERIFFVGSPRRVGKYRVYPVVSVLRAKWDRYPRLAHQHRRARTVTVESLQRAVVDELTRAATADLDKRESPRDMSNMPHVIAEDVIRRGADRFVRLIVALHGSPDAANFMRAMDEVAAQPYEGRTALGSMILANGDHPDVAYDLEFNGASTLRESRAFRKTLEMSGVHVSLVSDGHRVSGLGHLKKSYDSATESVYNVKVVARGSWEMSHGGVGLLRVENGRAHLPQERISRDTFVETAERVLGPDIAADKLWAQVQGAAKQQHGTMLVVHTKADSEAWRLGQQATLIRPTELSGEALASVTSIDGAILLRPDATCVAIGVILDGIASPGLGDPARGARYNSGIRYQAAATQGCLIVIVSEDGMIDLVPKLSRRVMRSAVEESVRRMEDAARSEETDFEVASKLEDHVRSLAFYLTQEQCERYNRSQERIEQARSAAGYIIRVHWNRLEPDPELNESYFLPEA